MRNYSLEKEIEFIQSNLHKGGELIGAKNGAINGFCMGISYYDSSEYGEPGVHDDQVEVREYLNLTISFDHDIVDGAPAARFTRKLVELVEMATVLEEVAENGVS